MSKILVCTMAENLPFKKLTKRYIKRYADAHGFGFYYHNSQTTLPSLKKMIRDSPGSNERLKMRASYLAAKFDLIKLAADSSDLWVVWVDGDILISKDADSIAPTLVDKNVLYGRLYFEEDNFCGGRNQWVKNLKLPTNERRKATYVNTSNFAVHSDLAKRIVNEVESLVWKSVFNFSRLGFIDQDILSSVCLYSKIGLDQFSKRIKRSLGYFHILGAVIDHPRICEMASCSNERKFLVMKALVPYLDQKEVMWKKFNEILAHGLCSKVLSRSGLVAKGELYE